MTREVIQITDEARILVEENHNLIYSFLSKYHLDTEEWYGLAAIGLCKAADTYNKGKSGFSTYAYKCMYTTVMQEKRKENQKGTIPQEYIFYYENQVENSNGDASNFLNYIPGKEKFEEKIILNNQLDQVEKELCGNRKRIFQLLRQGYWQNEISEIIGISKQRVSMIRKEISEKYYMGGSHE